MKPWLPDEAAGKRKSTPDSGAATSPNGDPTVECGNGHAQVPTRAPEPDGDGARSAGQPLVVREARSATRTGSPPVEPATARTTVPSPSTGPVPEPAPDTVVSRPASLWIWQSRGFWIGAVAVGLAMFAQKVLIIDKEVVTSIRWYALSIFVMIVGWLGTYRNKSVVAEVVAEEVEAPPPQPAPKAPLTTLPVRAKSSSGSGVVSQAPANKSASKQAAELWATVGRRFPGIVHSGPRYLIAFVALLLNLYSANTLRGDYYSTVGSIGWVISLMLLLGAFIGERRPKLRDPDAGEVDNEDRDRVRMQRLVEVAFVLVIMLLAFYLRVYRLDDWTGGMHGDEGETGMEGINILQGNRVSPFLTGWFAHPNFSFWSVALSMAAFGQNLFGLRILSTILGTLMVVPFYLLVRMWFGVRTAMIAAILLAIMDVSIYFGKLGLNNIMTPFFLVGGLYFLARGLRSLRTTDFVLSGYSFMLTLYFYFAGRLTPFLVAATIGYLFVLMPLVGLPGAYLSLRREDAVMSRLQAVRGAFVRQWRRVVPLIPKLITFGVACLCMASPWGVFFLDHQAEMNSRSNDKFIFNPANEGRMASEYGATRDPLYIGLRMPTPNDIYPFLPVVFEKTPLSVKVADDGFLARTFWGQTTKTLSIFTYRADNSSFFTMTGEPAAKPIEAALLVLGIAWALWRWRDHRMGVMSIWFWMTVLAGGVLTIDAPYMPRMVGLVPLLALLIAVPLNKMAAEFYNAFGRFRLKRPTWLRRALPIAVRAVSATLIVGLLVYLGLQNATDYNRYLNTFAYRDVTGQAYFVRQMREQVTSEGRPVPRFYDLGIHFIYWGHGNNRFLNYGTPGADMLNPSNDLPVLDSEGRDVVFMVWPHNRAYLSVLKTYYPGGEEAQFSYGPAGTASDLFTYYRVKSEQLDARRTANALYTPDGGQPLTRQEEGIGTTAAPPEGLTYPAKAEWAGSLVAPAMGRYKLAMEAQSDGSLVVDGTQVLTTTAGSPRAETELLLARGPHDFRLSGPLGDEKATVKLEWASGGAPLAPIARQYIWNGPGKALLGQITYYQPTDVASVGPFTPVGGAEPPKVLMSRIDGFLGFRHSPDALIGGQLSASWTGTLDIQEPGVYSFDVNSNGDSAVLIDDKLVTSIRANGGPVQAGGQVDLARGPHKFELRYNWSGGTGYLEAFWQPPGRERTLLGPDVLRTEGGIIDSSDLASEPPPAQVTDPGQATNPARRPKAVLGGEAGLKEPRGLGVDKAGNIYIGDKGNYRVVVLSPDGKVITTWGKPLPEDYKPDTGAEAPDGTFGNINDIAVEEGGDGQTYVYVLDGTMRVQVFTPQGKQVGTYPANQMGLYGPNGLAIGPSPDGGGQHKLYIAVTGQNRLVRLPALRERLQIPEGTPLSQAMESIEGSSSDKFEQPVDGVTDPTDSGIVYSIDLKDRLVQLQVLMRQGNPDEVPGRSPQSWNIVKQWRIPVGRAEGGSRLAISPDGKRVYMSDPDKSRVAVVDVETGLISYFGTDGRGEGQFAGPSGIAVSSDGTLYVLERVNNRVQTFDMNETQE